MAVGAVAVRWHGGEVQWCCHCHSDWLRCVGADLVCYLDCLPRVQCLHPVGCTQHMSRAFKHAMTGGAGSASDAAIGNSMRV